VKVPVVAARGVSYRYPSGPVALDDVSLELMTGEVVAVAGRNGAGKSTIARLVAGLLVPDAGSVMVAGVDTRGLAVADVARTVGLVFQHSRSQLFARTVAAELAFGPRNLGLPPEAVDARVARAAGRLELDDILAQSPFELPAPRRRLVAIAAVLSMEPQALVLDEPTTGQDAATAARIVDLVRDLRSGGTAILIVTHDMPLVASVADRLVAMAGGRVVAEGPPRRVFGDGAALEVAGLVAPQVSRLGLALPGGAERTVALTVEELAGALRRRPPAPEPRA
jgi:energy-coupling factor transporter ATP-binding protein EcfA2